jgi:hypothetical protein
VNAQQLKDRLSQQLKEGDRTVAELQRMLEEQRDNPRITGEFVAEVEATIEGLLRWGAEVRRVLDLPRVQQ